MSLQDNPSAEACSGAVPTRLPDVPHNLGIDKRANQDIDSSVAAFEPVTAGVEEEQGLALATQEADLETVTQAESTTADMQLIKDTSKNQKKSFIERLQERTEQLQAQAEQAQKQADAAAKGSARKQEFKPRKDFVITLILLAAGTLGALTLAQSMMLLPSQFSLLAAAIPEKQIIVPDSIEILGQVSALGILSLYAVMLLWTISRIRAKKTSFLGAITFWCYRNCGGCFSYDVCDV